MLAVDAKRCGTDRWEIYVNGGRTPTGIDCLEWVKKAVNLGAGEILLTSMDADGTKNGYDIPLTRAVAEAVNVPVIASGGAGIFMMFLRWERQTRCWRLPYSITKRLRSGR